MDSNRSFAYKAAHPPHRRWFGWPAGAAGRRM